VFLIVGQMESRHYCLPLAVFHSLRRSQKNPQAIPMPSGRICIMHVSNGKLSRLRKKERRGNLLGKLPRHSLRHTFESGAAEVFFLSVRCI
jgi:integrase